MTNAYNFGNFLTRFQGKNIDFDGYAGAQCADLPRKYIEDDDGWACQSYYYRPFEGNGAYGNDGVLDGFLSFEAGQQSVVQREGVDRKGKKFRVDIIKDVNDWVEGDIVFFKVPTHQYGHVGLRTNSDKVPNKVEVFDQNSRGNQEPCHWNNYPKDWFVASLRKVYIEEPTQPEQPPVDPCLNTKQDLEKANNQINDLKNQLSNIEIENRDLREKVKNLQDTNDTLASYNKIYLEEIDQFKKEIVAKDTKISQLQEQLTSAVTTPTQEKWDWQKHWVGLSKNGTFTAVFGIVLTSVVGYVIKYVPALAPFQQDMVTGILTFTGMAVTGQNVVSITKNI